MKKQLLNDCLRIAKNKNPRHPEWGNMHHFTFVIQRNKIVEYGLNRAGPPPPGFGYSSEYGKIHSEVSAFRKAIGIIDSSHAVDIINVRLNKQAQLRMSKPCKCCADYLRLFGCRAAYFSTNSGFSRMLF